MDPLPGREEITRLLAALADTGPSDEVVHFDLPAGSWRQVATGTHVSLEGVEGEYARLGGGGHHVPVPARSFLVWVRD